MRVKSYSRPPDLTQLSRSNASEYVFIRDGVKWDLDRLRTELVLSGAQENLTTIDWVQNHYSMIIQKLASFLRFFPEFLSEYWSPHKVLSQLRYRYETEINVPRSSALKNILQRDEFASRHIVLYVSDIVKLDDSIRKM